MGRSLPASRSWTDVSTPGGDARAWVPLGYVARAHGVRGTLRVHWHDPIDALQAMPPQLRMVPKQGAPVVLDIARHRLQADGTSLVDFDKITNLDDVAHLRGARVEVQAEHLPPAEPGEVYLYRMMGCRCVDEAGLHLGTLAHVHEHGPNVVLGIADAQGEEQLLPLTERTLRRFDADARVAVLEVPEGLWDL